MNDDTKDDSGRYDAYMVAVKKNRELRKEISIIKEYAKSLEDLLEKVSLENMGGTPDLFCPNGYGPKEPWEKWDEDVRNTIERYRKTNSSNN